MLFVVIVVPVMVGAYTIVVVLSTELNAYLSVIRAFTVVAVRYATANHPVAFCTGFATAVLLLFLFLCSVRPQPRATSSAEQTTANPGNRL